MAFCRTPIAVGLAMALAAAPAAARSQVFDLTLAGIPLGTVTLEADEAGGAYRAGSRIAPSGLVGAFTDYSFNGTAEGSVDAAGRVTPLRFAADSTSPRASRRTEIEWSGGAPVRVSVEPPRRSSVDPSRVAGALDPVSAGFALLRDNNADKICDTGIDVFDGSRRSRLELGKPVATEGALVCSGSYARVEGEAHSLSSQREYPFTLTFVPNGGGKMRLERIETRTRFGLAVVSRRG